MPLAEAQAAFAQHGPDARARPAARRGDARDGRRRHGHRRLRPAAPPLRRRARPRRRHDGRAVRRHDRQVGRQGDQERRGLRPRQAVRRLLRHARADRPRRRAAAPAARAHRDGDRARRRPGRARPPARGALAALPLEADCLDVALGAAAAGALLVRFAGSAAAEQARRPRPSASRLGGAGSRGRRRRAGTPQRARQRSADGVVRQGLRAPDRPARRARAPRATHGGTVVSRAALGLSWLRCRRAPTSPRSARRCAPRPCAVLDGADRVGRSMARAADGRARGDGARQGALRPRPDLPPGHLRGRI